MHNILPEVGGSMILDIHHLTMVHRIVRGQIRGHFQTIFKKLTSI